MSLRETATTGSSGEPDQVWRYYEVAVRLAARLGQVSTENEALESILPLLLARSSWDVGCLWLVALDQRRLVCWSTWPGDGGPTQVFQEASRMIRPRVGEGLPGSAWGSGRPLMTNVAIGETRLLRQQAIRAAGLNTGVAFPLVSESGVLGVIEMFARKSDGMSLRVLEALAHIGQQIGNLLEHLREERRLREEARLRTFLLEAATAIAESTDYREALSTLAAIAVPEMGDLCLIDVKEPDGELMRMAAVHWDDTKADLVAELGAVYSPVRGSTHPANEVIDSGVSSWSAFMGDEYLRRTSRDERHFEILKLLGFESYMCIPLMDGDEVLGAITLVSAGSGRRFTAADLALPEELAARASTVIGAARRHQREHDLAHQLQKLLLPEVLPEVPGCGICVRYSAGAPQADTGGDFYDVVQLSPRRTALLIGDVEGHDTVAAAVMGQLRSASRALAGQVDGPAELVDALRASWETLGFRRMATALFAWLDPVTGDVAISSAGHLPPAYLHGGEATFVSVHAGPPFGVRTGSSPEIQMRLEPGDALVLYTDGLVEQRGVELEARMGVLLEAVRGRSRHTTLDDFCEHLISALVPEVHRLHDDIALLTVERS